MRVDISPRQATVTPGQPQAIHVTITNTGTVIGGYTLRVLGADPSWVDIESDQISLFPDETRTLTVVITPPLGIPAGVRRVAAQVRELTPPEASSVIEVDLTVPESRAVQLRVDPLAVTAGRRAGFSVLVENTGNTMVKGQLAGDDPENRVVFTFTPDRLVLAPGEHAVADLDARARRHLTGAPVVRMLSLYVDDLPPERFFSEAVDTTAAVEPAPPSRAEGSALANATFIQKSVFSRGAFSLLGLLAAVTVFAIVITVALSRLVGQTAADRDLALQVAAARDQAATGGTGSVHGTVRQLTSRDGVNAVSVSVFSAADTSTPIETTATAPDGTYQVSALAAGDYKIAFRGAGYLEIWYPGAATDADATTVTLAPGEQRQGVDVQLGGVPATISGTVTGDDVSASTLYLETDRGATHSVNAAHTRPLTVAPVPPPDNGEAVVMTVPIGADGSFSLTGVPSPAQYDLVVTKPGHATSTQRIDIGAGENRTGVQLRLTTGDGSISGIVTSSGGPLGGATITATAGQTSASTVSLNRGTTGAFTLSNLPTPASFTIVASLDNYASQTLTLTLGAGQTLKGVAISLSKSSATLSGKVAVQGHAPSAAGGITVTVTDGVFTVQTATDSETSPGGWTVSGLPTPGTYTVSFTRRDLAAQTVSVSVDANGLVQPGSSGTTLDRTGRLLVTMQSSTGGLTGIVRQPPTQGLTALPLGEAQVTLSSGASSYSVTTASVPAKQQGVYDIENLPAGTYTLTVSAGSGTSPTSQLVQILAGTTRTLNVPLAAPASLVGTLHDLDDAPLCGWTVEVYVADQYPNTVSATTKTTCPGDSTDGGFQFEGVDAGTYIVEVRATPASAPVLSKQVFVQASRRTDAGVLEVNSGG